MRHLGWYWSATARGFNLLALILTVSLFLPVSLHGQAWSNFLDSSRAISWSPGFTIPSYTTPCATQPTLQTGSSSAAANTIAINNALASCDSTHNVVNLPSGTYYVNSITYGTQGHQVLRGAGAGTGGSATYLYILGQAPCGQGGICMVSSSPLYNGNPAVLPPSGSNQCMWSGGYSQGTTSITLSSCGGAPPLNQTMILDQANDSATDTGGVWLCDAQTGSYRCTYKPLDAGNSDGRVIGGVDYSQQEVVYVTGVTNNGGGSYTVTISPGVYFTNIRSGQSPGAWWPGFVQNDGIENLTLDYSQSTAGANNYGAIGMYNCYQCWVKGIQSIDAGRDHVFVYQSDQDVVRDSYFYQSQSHSSVSYTIEVIESSNGLIENTISQQVTTPIIFGQGSGFVMGYNFGVDNVYTTPSSFMNGSYYSHNAGSEFNLWEGNMFSGIWVDDAWGTSDQGTMFRNSIPGWQSGKTNSTVPLIIRAWSRDYSYVGNILGQPGYHTEYQTYATSGTGGVNGNTEDSAIYSIGWADTGGTCTSQEPPCDALSWSTLMRWGNYDTVNAATQWNSTEASPAANTYVNANFTSSYFSSLAHTLPASLYYSSTPSWWPSGKHWPPIGPDVSTGNVGICSSGSSYPGAQATASSQCTGGTLQTAWASTVTSIPAEDCYLNVMGGPPDGSGSVLSFNASTCYSAADPPQPPTNLAATVD
ncbi:MAG TPA: hypothetical protein VEG68_03995 [Terriglobales bacterium]|nr:hypothetical protein [Terriglobales bacterium]